MRSPDDLWDGGEWGEPAPSHSCGSGNCLAPYDEHPVLPPKVSAVYHGKVSATTEVPSMEHKECGEIPLNQAVFSAGAPKNWIMNVRKEHGPIRRGEDSADYPTQVVDPCPGCLHCVKKAHEDKGLKVGAPVQVHPSYPSDKLKEMGLVGIYYLSANCAICGDLINIVDGQVEEGSELVHVHCLPDDAREVLADMGVTSGYIQRGKQNGEETPSSGGNGVDGAAHYAGAEGDGE